MATRLEAGTRLRSVTCDTEVIVVKAPPASLDLRCGGTAMAAGDVGRVGPPVPPFDGGTRMGKRYADEGETLELLCTKSGDGSLSLDESLLHEKGAKPLPASD